LQVALDLRRQFWLIDHPTTLVFRRKCSDLGEDSQGARFDSGGSAAAGDNHWQSAHFGFGNQSGADGSRRWCCRECRAFGGTVIAGVLKNQMDEARTMGADQVLATDDDKAIANLPMLGVVAGTANGKIAAS
jgi:hypothetical protein